MFYYLRCTVSQSDCRILESILKSANKLSLFLNICSVLFLCFTANQHGFNLAVSSLILMRLLSFRFQTSRKTGVNNQICRFSP